MTLRLNDAADLYAVPAAHENENIERIFLSTHGLPV